MLALYLGFSESKPEGFGGKEIFEGRLPLSEGKS
jgi:hypothetical protein